MALVLYPDKNDSLDAEVQFRQLATVYEVWNDMDRRRRMYNKVLVEGLNLLVIVTSIQYCVNWAAYYERKLTISWECWRRSGKKQGKD